MDHHHIHCNCDSTTYNEQTTRQSTHSPCPLFNNRKNNERKKIFSWKIIALIFILTTLCFLTSTIYLSIIQYYNPTFREINSTKSNIYQHNFFYGWLNLIH